jgi:hypothetical protein
MEVIIRNILRIVQILWALLLTALLGNVVATNISAAGTATAAVNFGLFATVVGWLAALYGIGSHFIESLAMPMLALGLDGAATLFTTIAGIVLAAKLKATNCASKLDPKDLGDDWIGFGSANDEKRCREIQAGTVFMWFLAVTLAVSLFFTLTGWRRGGGSTRASSVGGPSMSQFRV